MLIAEQQLERKKLEWASWVEKEFSKCKNARLPFERQWYINLAFLSGKQYLAPVDVAGHGFRLTVPKAPPWRVRLVINKIRTAIRTECSKLTTSKPIPTVVPATTEDEDFSAALVAEQILKTKFATADFESTYRSWVWWGSVCGTSFMKMYWDSTAMDYESKSLPPLPTLPGSNDPIPEEMIDMVPGLREHLNTPVPSRGKICIDRVTPFHLYVPDLLKEDLQEQPYVMQVLTQSPLWVKQRYGFTPNCDARASNTLLDAATIISKGTEDHLDSVVVKEVWLKPGAHKDFPEGGFFVVINGKIVEYRDKWPYPFPEFPFYKYDGIPTGGFYSDSIIVDLIPVQKEYNKTRSQAIEIKNMMGKPKLVYQRGSLNPRKISSEPGQSIEYIAGYEKPDIIPGVEVPTSMLQEVEMLSAEFDDLSGQHEISRGQTSLSSLTSGTAIAYLQEQDDAKLNYQVASIENACEKMGNHYLILASHNWDNERVIRVTGKNQNFEAIHWKQGMLKGNTDVKVQTGSALPFSKAARTALISEHMMNGFIDPQTGLEMLEIGGGMDKMLDDALVDKRQAMRENLKMASLPESVLGLLLNPAPGPNGEPPLDEFTNGDGTPFQPQPPIPVNSWDNHEEHIRWHNHFRKTQQFEMLPDLNKQAFELHVQLHQMALMATIQNHMGMNVSEPEEPEFNEFGEEEEFNEDPSNDEGSHNFQE